MSIIKRGGIYHISISINGRRIRKTAGKGATKAQAKAIERKLTDDAMRHKMGLKPERTLSEALLKWLDDELIHLKGASKFESHARALIPFIKGKLLDQAPEVAEDFKRTCTQQGLSPATINRRLAILRRVCNLAYKQWKWIDIPIGDRFKLLTEHNERHVYLTPAQVIQLANACDNQNASDMIMLAAYTGLRRGELFRLTKDNLVDGCIVLDAKTKSGRPRVVPVPAEALRIAEILPLPLSDPQLRKEWDKARKRTGFTDIRFHDLRHTYASWLVQAGAPLKAVQDLLGHSTLSMTQRYAHLGTEHLKDAVKLIGKK